MKIFITLSVLLLGLYSWATDTVPAKPNFYSLYTWASEFPGFADEVEKVGFKWMRTGGPIGEPAEEKGILEAAKRGIRCTPVIGGNDKAHLDNKKINIEAWKKTVKDFVLRYCEGGSFWKENPSVKPMPVEYIEIWNEPNIEYLVPPEGKKRDETYYEFLKAAYEEIKRLNPKLKVVGMNTSGGALKTEGGLPPEAEFKGLFGWFKFIKGVNKLGGGKYYDILGIHPYTRNKPPDKAGYIKALDAIRAECKANGSGEKPVWVTEVGYSLPMKTKTTSGGGVEGDVKTEDEQANFMIRFLGLSAANGVEQFQIMYITDIHNYAAGLFDRSKKWRKQAYAIKNMMEIIPDPVLVKKISEGDESVFAYVFKGAGGKDVIMAWSTNKEEVEKEFEVKGNEMTIVARDGEKKNIKAVAGKVKVNLSQSPVYLY